MNYHQKIRELIQSKFDRHPWVTRNYEEVARRPNFLGSMFRGRNFEIQSLMNDIFSMRRSFKGNVKLKYFKGKLDMLNI